MSREFLPKWKRLIDCRAHEWTPKTDEELPLTSNAGLYVLQQISLCLKVGKLSAEGNGWPGAGLVLDCLRAVHPKMNNSCHTLPGPPCSALLHAWKQKQVPKDCLLTPWDKFLLWLAVSVRCWVMVTGDLTDEVVLLALLSLWYLFQMMLSTYSPTINEFMVFAKW